MEYLLLKPGLDSQMLHIIYQAPATDVILAWSVYCTIVISQALNEEVSKGGS